MLLDASRSSLIREDDGGLDTSISHAGSARAALSHFEITAAMWRRLQCSGVTPRTRNSTSLLYVKRPFKLPASLPFAKIASSDAVHFHDQTLFGTGAPLVFRRLVAWHGRF